MNEETKLPKTEAELRRLLEAAIEGGRQMGPREIPAELHVSKAQLQEQFNARIASIRADRRGGISKVRAVQAEFQELGLTAEEVDLNPPHLNWRGRTIHDWAPPSR